MDNNSLISVDSDIKSIKFLTHDDQYIINKYLIGYDYNKNDHTDIIHINRHISFSYKLFHLLDNLEKIEIYYYILNEDLWKVNNIFTNLSNDNVKKLFLNYFFVMGYHHNQKIEKLYFNIIKNFPNIDKIYYYISSPEWVNYSHINYFDLKNIYADNNKICVIVNNTDMLNTYKHCWGKNPIGIMEKLSYENFQNIIFTTE
jgi:hypothetical protein